MREAGRNPGKPTSHEGSKTMQEMEKFKVLGHEVESCDMTVQVELNEEWVDYSSIKDAADAMYAERFVDSPDDDGVYRIVWAGGPNGGMEVKAVFPDHTCKENAEMHFDGGLLCGICGEVAGRVENLWDDSKPDVTVWFDAGGQPAQEVSE